jgi:2-Cys peroxiredoxin 5
MVADNAVGDDQGTFGAAIGLVFDAQAFFGGPRLQRGAIVIDNGKVVSVVVENSPPEGE